MLSITTSTSDELFSRINVDNFKRPYWFCNLRLQRTLQEWTATKWLKIDWQFANRNCYRLSRVLWALAQISCCFGCVLVQLSTICLSCKYLCFVFHFWEIKVDTAHFLHFVVMTWDLQSWIQTNEYNTWLTILDNPVVNISHYFSLYYLSHCYSTAWDKL